MDGEFFKKLLVVVKNQDNSEFSESIDFDGLEKVSENKKEEYEKAETEDAPIKKILDFANKCYVHGVTVGMQLAAEIYTENER
jgi:hypothetical protein